MSILSALRFFSTQSRPLQPLLGPIEEWCNPGLFPEVFTVNKRIRSQYYQNMAEYYPFLNFTGIPLNDRFSLPANPTLQKILLSATGLTRLDEFDVLKTCCNLNHLDLSFNAIGHTDAMRQLAAICRARKETLLELDLEGVDLSLSSPSTLKRLIPQKSVLQRLFLISSRLTDEHARYLASGIQRKIRPLATLSLSDNPDISPARLLDILQALAARPGVSNINFDHCARFETAQEDDVLEAVFRMNSLQFFTLPAGTPPMIALGVADALSKNQANERVRLISRTFFDHKNRASVLDENNQISPESSRLI
ncbi:hypothetical protein [Legionella sp. CNM-4043-24]|uniref:hypothetical protein n=1 Tax=Legionella sp. CNM-4043-24 TaxID=3421646 RepID=UPI00403A9CFF